MSWAGTAPELLNLPSKLLGLAPLKPELLVWWSWLTQSGLSMWVEWVRIYCKIPYKYIHGKQSVSGKLGVLLRNTDPQYLSFDITVFWPERQIIYQDTEHVLCLWFGKEIVQSLLLNCETPKGTQEQLCRVTPHLICFAHWEDKDWVYNTLEEAAWSSRGHS